MVVMKRALLQESIGSAAARHRGLRQLFETLGLDYYCEGQFTIDEACQDAAVDLDTAWPVMAEAARGDPGVNWQEGSLRTLVSYLESEHHAITRGVLFRIGLLFTEACAAGDVRLTAMRESFRRFTETLVGHMEREELMVFPAILALEESWIRGEPPPARLEGGIRAVVSKLVLEHYEISRQLCALRDAREAVVDTEEAAFARLFGELEALERHLHEYMNLENYVAFPRALALEEALTERAVEMT